MHMIRPFAAAAALAVLPALGACTNEDPAAEVTSDGDAARRTLAAAIGGAPGLTTVSGALSEAGLADVFDGPGSYTVLAPDDDAFAKLGPNGEALTSADHRAELVAVLRGHILPGHLTPDAIRKAIADTGGPVSMRTLDDGMVTFTAQGNTIAVSSSDGSKAIVDGAAIVASNGVVLPLDGLVKSVTPGPAG